MHTQTGAGTSFRVFIPAAVAETSIRRESADPGMPRGNGELILIVDDEGVRLYQENGGRIDAVISDMAMPSMDGPAMIRGLREIDPAVRIIATTGMTSRAGIEAIGALKVDALLAKPCAAADLLGKVRDVLHPPV